MKILIAEDDLVSRRVLKGTLEGWGHDVVATCDGHAAWQALQGEGAPKLAILDWMMPELDGPEVCRRLSACRVQEPTYVILLTAKDATADIVEGLDAGANDYITKPFDRKELQARLRVGQRVVELQGHLATRVRELEEALTEVKQLQTLLPICCYCKKVRDDNNYWQQVETYFVDHSDVRFSHGICPDCLAREIKVFHEGRCSRPRNQKGEAT
jgi:DNA-binding response OmpR family regulator